MGGGSGGGGGGGWGVCFFFNDTATTEIYTLSLHDALPISQDGSGDYTSVFDGLTAAQDGDTVSIGPGTYSEMRDVTLDGRQFKAIGVVTASDVQVIGEIGRAHV